MYLSSKGNFSFLNLRINFFGQFWKYFILIFLSYLFSISLLSFPETLLMNTRLPYSVLHILIFFYNFNYFMSLNFILCNCPIYFPVYGTLLGPSLVVANMFNQFTQFFKEISFFFCWSFFFIIPHPFWGFWLFFFVLKHFEHYLILMIVVLLSQVHEIPVLLFIESAL